MTSGPDPDTRRLVDSARAAAVHAYAPYSTFRVGAAVAAVGGVYTGANVENSSYGLSLCAERAALAAAVTAGERRFTAIAVACIDGAPGQDLTEFMPCGACRQWMQELAPDLTVLISVPSRPDPLIFTLPALLPLPFTLGG
jgi:cytidine deaminase